MTSHDEGPRTSKPSSPPEEPDSRILRGYYGAKEFSGPGPLHTKPDAHTEEEELLEDQQREPQSPGGIAKDNPVLGQPKL